MIAEQGVLLLQGALAGLAVSAPPGPVGALCVRRTLRCGLWAGLATALGALLADVAYAVVATCGLTQFEMPGAGFRRVACIVVALVLLGLGVKTFRQAHRAADATEAPEPATARGNVGLIAATFLLTLATPGTLPAFIAVFAGLGTAARAAACPGGIFTVLIGVVAGAALWWIVLSCVVHRFRSRAGRWVVAMEYGCAALLIVGAAGAAWSGFTQG